MEKWYRVKDVSGILGCNKDTARARMQEMEGVINVGSQKRRQLMVPEYGLEDWLRNHRISGRGPAPVIGKPLLNSDGTLVKRDRRTGKLRRAV